MANLVLYDLSGELIQSQFRDAAATAEDSSPPAFTIERVATSPDVIKISRDESWEQSQPNVTGPSKIFLYFGPDEKLGYLVFGNAPTQSMNAFLKRKHTTSRSRWFTSLNGAEYKWKHSTRRLECFDKSGLKIASYEYLLDQSSYAKLTVKSEGRGLLSEIITTLVLNRVAIKHDL